jgi:hypothetical protein
MADTKNKKQSNLNEDSEKFWGKGTKKATGRFVNFVDGQPVTIEISDWNVRKIDTNWGKKPALNTVDGRILKIESLRLRWEIEQYVSKHVKLEITRFDSIPNPLNTWYDVKLIEEL